MSLPLLKYQEQFLHPVFRCSVSIPVHLGGEVETSMPYDHHHEVKPLGHRYLPLVEYCPCYYGECATTILAPEPYESCICPAVSYGLNGATLWAAFGDE